MLQAHSLLWHYLWLAPHILQVALAVLLWQRGLHKLFPVFLAYTIFEAIEEFTLYAMDVLPSVRAETFWQAFWVGLIIEGVIRFALIGEIFRHLLRPWPAVANLGNRLISSTGVVLVLLATLGAAYAPIDNPQYSFISRAHILQQTLYIVQCGLVLFLFVFAAYFRLVWNNRTFGIALGLGILSCEHLATWAIMANGGLSDKRYLLDFLNMATYHFCVLIWFYYLLVPQKIRTKSAVPLPEHDLEIWNRELERLLQQ
jgi:hypothetical protein